MSLRHSSRRSLRREPLCRFGIAIAFLGAGLVLLGGIAGGVSHRPVTTLPAVRLTARTVRTTGAKVVHAAGTAHAGDYRAEAPDACSDAPITPTVGVTTTSGAAPNGLSAWQDVDVTFSASNLSGDCAGDSFTIALPPELSAADIGPIPLDDSNGDEIATLTVENGVATVTLTAFAETHQDVSVQGFAEAQLDDTYTPGSSDTLQFTVNGSTNVGVPITMGSGPCQGDCAPPPAGSAEKWGSYDAGPPPTEYATVEIGQTTQADQSVTVSDELTSSGQQFDCPVTAYVTSYSGENEWGTPTGGQAVGNFVSTSCSTTSASWTFSIPTAGDFAEIGFPVAVTDTSDTSWTDSATVTTEGKSSPPASATISQSDAGGSGSGDTTTTTTVPVTTTTVPVTTTTVPVTTTTSSTTSTTVPVTTTSTSTTSTTVPVTTTSTSTTSTTVPVTTTTSTPTSTTSTTVPATTSTTSTSSTTSTTVPVTTTTGSSGGTTASGSGGGSTGGGSSLAFTGLDAEEVIAVGVALLLLGGALTALGRRRSTHNA